MAFFFYESSPFFNKLSFLKRVFYFVKSHKNEDNLPLGIIVTHPKYQNDMHFHKIGSWKPRNRTGNVQGMPVISESVLLHSHTKTWFSFVVVVLMVYIPNVLVFPNRDGCTGHRMQQITT